MKSLKKEKRRIYGIRQVDDLLLVIAFDKKSNQSYKEALQWKKEFLEKDKVYKGGLELEEQKELKTQKKEILYEFSGTVVTLTEDSEGKLLWYCKTRNKNEHMLLSEGRQKIPRYLENDSMVPKHYKMGMQIATLLRLHSQTNRLEDLVNAIKINCLEMKSIGYDDNFLIIALQNMIYRSRIWIDVIEKIHKEDNQIFIKNSRWRRIYQIAIKMKSNNQ